MTYGFLGPEGTFTQQAARYFAKDSELLPYNNIIDMIFSLDRGEIDYCVAPIENTTEGNVNQTLDTLIFDVDLFIKSEISLPIIQNLMINKKNINKKIEKILSHPQGLAQTSKFLNKNFNNIPTISTNSTAEAAKIVSETDEPLAAIGVELCAEIYNLEIICRNIQDNSNNKTMFVLLTKEDTKKPKEGNKTSLAFSTYNKPGELYKILDIFSLWDINLSKITSRPMKNKSGEYIFYIDIDSFIDIKDVEDALNMVKRKTNFFKILGTYNTVNQ